MAYTELAVLAQVPSAGREIRRACTLQVVVLGLLILAVIAVPMADVPLAGIPLSAFVFSHQDIYFVPFVFATCLLHPTQERAAGTTPSLLAQLGSGAAPAVIALLLVIVCWAGHYLVFDGYNLSRDEAMAFFDAFIFGHGRLAWPIPAEWRPLATALNQVFIMPIGRHDAWVSAYLPVNAALRAAVGHVADPWLTSPLFVGLGALSLWRISLRLWPHSPTSRSVALILYAGSAQVWLAGMTAYAMSAHLGLDLLWLWLFLRGGKRDHVGAIIVGFLATGLHQPLFHPLFVLPFCIDMLVARRLRLFLFYGFAYAAIGLFWMSWPGWIANGLGAAAETHDVGYVNRLLQTVDSFDLKSVWVMALNLLRFATWQHLMLVPLLSLGIVVGRTDPLARALTLGFVLPIVVMAIILPVQGHGWGYRYLHGVIGNACLLGGYGWRWLEARGLTFRRPLLWTSILTFIGLPVHAAMAHAMVHPYAATAAKIASIDTDIVIIDADAAPWAGDLVINRPDLNNRPVRLAAGALRAADMARLCRGRTIAFVDEADLLAINVLFARAASGGTPAQQALEDAARQAGCAIVKN